jgi:Holliday junction resolvase RusA-like endonuclease
MRKSSTYVTWLMLAAVEARKQTFGRVDGPYHLSIQAARPDHRRRDIDNLIKPLSDLLVQIGVVRDDSDCEMVSARWVTTGEGVFVRITPAGLE